jgi:predicted O-methyltransferase YrrM
LTSLNAKRVLAIGTPLPDLSIENLLAPDGMLIVMEPDRTRAETARRHLSAAGLESRATVIAGDPRRMLYKLAGPFDVIFCDPAYLSVRGLAERLLTPDGVLITSA